MKPSYPLLVERGGGDRIWAAVRAQAAIDEQCFPYSECGPLAPYTAAGKPVFEAEYSSRLSSYCPAHNAADTNAVRCDFNLDGAVRITCR